MKKTVTIIKISLALTVAFMIGIWLNSSIDLLDKQANAIELQKDMKPLNTTFDMSKKDASSTIKLTEKLPKEVVSTNAPSTTEQEDGKQAFTSSLVYELAVSFEAPIYWAIAENDVLVDYDSIEQLVLEHYVDFANLDLARNFVYAFFYEEDGQVRLMPGQLPKLFNMDQDFEMNQVTENEFNVKQADVGYDGTTVYRVFIFKLNEKTNTWKIEDILYE